MIPSIAPWINRKHGEVNFCLTQLLSGHGCFLAYLHRFKLEDTPFCPLCEPAVEDAEHVFFECPRFHLQRRHVMSIFGIDPLTPEAMVGCMLASETNWAAVSAYAQTTIAELRRIERERREVD